MARAEKSNPYPTMKRTVLKDWAWANPYYELEIPSDKKVKYLSIDATGRMADIHPSNNNFEAK